MRHSLMLTALVIAAVGGAPRLAAAGDCADNVIEGCDKAFAPTSLFGEPFRGWCYLFGLANCALS